MVPTRRNFLTAGAVVSASAMLGAEAPAALAQAAPGGSMLGKSYAETAQPKPWLKPQRPSKPISIDVHSHWSPPSYLKAKADLGQPDTLPPINADMERRIAWMDEHGVQALVLTLGGFRPWGWVTAQQGAMIARGVNDEAIAAHEKNPTRILAGIELNCSDPVGSLAELNRVAGHPGMVCVHFPTSLAGHDFLFDPAFQLVLARIEELGLPVLLHPLDGEPNWFAGKRLDDAASGVDPKVPGSSGRFPGLTNSLGNSLEMGVCISKFIMSGTLDRFPKLTCIATCAGGALPYVGGRIEQRTLYDLPQPFYTYLRRFYYDTLTYWPGSLHYLAQMVGVDRIVLGTDNMFSGGRNMAEQPHSIVDQAGFADVDRAMILGGNLRRLFKL